MLAFFLSVLENPDDRQWFTALYERYRDRMGRIALNILHNEQDAEDAVQNAFHQIVRHFELVPQVSREKLPFWILAITKNEAYAMLRTKSNTVPLDDWDGCAYDTAGYGYVELLEMLDKLPETYHSVMEMKFLLGLTDSAIARKLGISETAVSTRVSRGRALLRKILEEEGFFT